MKLSYLPIFLLLFLICNSCNQNKNRINYSWVKNDIDDWPQILLTNKISFKNRVSGSASGASAFLVFRRTTYETFVCTAKHLLGEVMGIEPEVTVDSVDILLEKWLLYPRQNTKSSDTLEITNIISTDIKDRDIAVFDYSPKNNNIQALKPRFSKLREEENLRIIGCNYFDFECHQKIYQIKYWGEQDGLGIAEMVDKLSIEGFSGAPVIDKRGYVVGVVLASAEDDSLEYVVFEPITTIKKLLE